MEFKEGQKLDEKELTPCKECGKANDACLCGMPSKIAEAASDTTVSDAERKAGGEDNASSLGASQLSKVSSASKDIAPFDPWIGQTINEQYEIVSLIARGGMGAVYRARHKLLGTNRAIKVIRPDVHRDDVVYQRFRQEAQAVEGLSHPNIVSFYDYGIFEGVAPYVVMDLVDGVSLDAAIKADGGKLEISKALGIFVQVSGALAHAHSKGILHRDIKPGNIMLVKDEFGQESPKVLDFGIAKIQSQNPDGDSGSLSENKLTGTGEIFGSPAYMSPEQGNGQPVSARSDVYSLGCVLYEAIVGKPPFEGRNAIETIMQHLNNSVPKLPKPSKAVDQNLFNDLENIIMRCLEKEPSERYPNMRELQEDLKRLSYGERLLKLQQEKAKKTRIAWMEKIHKIILVIIAIAIVPAGVYFVYVDPSGWHRELLEALQDQDNADKNIQQIISKLNPDAQMYLWNRGFLLWNQAQIYRLKSSGASNDTLLALAEEKYLLALDSIEQFAKTKQGFPRMIQQQLADTYDGLCRCALLQVERDHKDHTADIEQARLLTKDGRKIEAEEAKRNVILKAIYYIDKSIEIRRGFVKGGMEPVTAVPLAQALDLEARALFPLGDLDRIIGIISEQESILWTLARGSWMHVDSLVNRSEVLELGNYLSLALADLKVAKEYERQIYFTERDPFVMEIQRKIDVLERKLKESPNSDRKWNGKLWPVRKIEPEKKDANGNSKH